MIEAGIEEVIETETVDMAGMVVEGKAASEITVTDVTTETTATDNE